MARRLAILVFFCVGCFCLFGQSAKQHIKAGEQFLSNGLLDAASAEFRKAILLEPNEGKIYQLIASVLVLKEDSLEAAGHYRRAAALGYEQEKNYLNAGNIYYKTGQKDKAWECIEQGLALKPKSFNLLLLKTRILFKEKDYNAAYISANEAIKSKDLAIAYYYSGASAFRLNHFEQALKDLEKSIIRDKNLSDSYLELAELQLSQKQYEYAIDNCSMVLLLIDPQNVRALHLRSKAFHAQREPDQALVDITKAISLEKNNLQLYLERAGYNLDYAYYSAAIDDYSFFISKSDTSTEALRNRAYSYEQLGKKTEARNDYIQLYERIAKAGGRDELKGFAQNKIFELGKEENKPEILIEQPQLTTSYELNVKENEEKLVLSGTIVEETKLKSLKINNEQIKLEGNNGNVRFKTELATSGLDFVTITAADIYDNISTVSYPIKLIENDPPIIKLISPTAGINESISVEAGDNTLYIEGKIEDRSYITEIKIDEVNASFAPGDYNPRFTATIDVKNRKNLTIRAKDVFGNEAKTVYEFYTDGKMLSGNNPMGKTWVVVIENTDYKEYSNLSSPKSDVEELIENLDQYKISKVLHKKNLSKRELERFFAIDLRDLMISNKVKSLLIWYAGHGQTMNNTGYWIPIDGRLNDEYSYYNLNALKASLYSYRSLTHILIISDACKAGESFSIAMRGDNTLASCEDSKLVQQKSALILTSSNTEAAMDNSLFTKTFINSLANNPADCIPVDAIAERISIVMYKHTAQKPVFGRISGLEDKNGTFFFMRK